MSLSSLANDCYRWLTTPTCDDLGEASPNADRKSSTSLSSSTASTSTSTCLLDHLPPSVHLRILSHLSAHEIVLLERVSAQQIKCWSHYSTQTAAAAAALSATTATATATATATTTTTTTTTTTRTPSPDSPSSPAMAENASSTSSPPSSLTLTQSLTPTSTTAPLFQHIQAIDSIFQQLILQYHWKALSVEYVRRVLHRFSREKSKQDKQSQEILKHASIHQHTRTHTHTHAPNISVERSEIPPEPSVTEITLTVQKNHKWLFSQLSQMDAELWRNMRTQRHAMRVAIWRSFSTSSPPSTSSSSSSVSTPFSLPHLKSGLYPVLAFNNYNEVDDVLFITSWHYVGYLSYFFPFLTSWMSWKTCLMGVAATTAFRYIFWESYWDEQGKEKKPVKERRIAAYRALVWGLIVNGIIKLFQAWRVYRNKMKAAQSLVPLAVRATGAASASLPI